MEVSARTRYTGISARKMRLVVNEVRGMDAGQAVNMLGLMPQAAAGVLAGTISSAMANAEANFDLDPDEMFIKTIYADEAPRRRWRRFGGRGRFKPWQRNSSSVTVILDETDTDYEDFE